VAPLPLWAKLNPTAARRRTLGRRRPTVSVSRQRPRPARSGRRKAAAPRGASSLTSAHASAHERTSENGRGGRHGLLHPRSGRSGRCISSATKAIVRWHPVTRARYLLFADCRARSTPCRSRALPMQGARLLKSSVLGGPAVSTRQPASGSGCWIAWKGAAPSSPRAVARMFARGRKWRRLRPRVPAIHKET
jgi:hypothetical protein